MTRTSIALAILILACAVVAAPTEADAGRKRDRAVVNVVEVPVVASGFIYPGGGWHSPPVYHYSPIETDPLCVWRHQSVCNPWFCQARKHRVCY
jgi:hypothetical protein